MGCYSIALENKRTARACESVIEKFTSECAVEVETTSVRIVPVSGSGS
jgi:hypothetical protein